MVFEKKQAHYSDILHLKAKALSCHSHMKNRQLLYSFFFC